MASSVDVKPPESTEKSEKSAMVKILDFRTPSENGRQKDRRVSARDTLNIVSHY